MMGNWVSNHRMGHSTSNTIVICVRRDLCKIRVGISYSMSHRGMMSNSMDNRGMMGNWVSNHRMGHSKSNTMTKANTMSKGNTMSKANTMTKANTMSKGN